MILVAKADAVQTLAIPQLGAIVDTAHIFHEDIQFSGLPNAEGHGDGGVADGFLVPTFPGGLLFSVDPDLRPVVEHAYTVDLGNPRALPAATYAKYLSNHNISATPHESVERALTAAIDDCKRDGCPLLCLGSLYLYNAVLDALGK
jgi:hypothetical protein